MDELYDDLDNYNDVNTVEELRKENIELKSKLEEYTISFNNLQADFDRVSSELKAMATNYSSLLKTARAEIKRKTDIITNLNMEKDLFILNSIKNKNILNVQRNLRNRNITDTRKSCESDSRRHKCASTQQEKNEKFNEGRPTSEETISSHNTESSRTVSAQGSYKTKHTHINDRMSDAKENVSHEINDLKKNKDDCNNERRKADSIRKRRQSMPALSDKNPKITSDEESEDKRYSTDKSTKTELPPKHITRSSPRRYNSDKNNDDSNKKDFKYHENSREFHYNSRNTDKNNLRTKQSPYPETSREAYHYNSRNIRSHDFDRHKNRDKYEYSHRYRRQGTPEKYRRSHREQFENQHHRSDTYKGTELISPSRDRHHKRSPDRRYNYNEEHSSDYGRYSENRGIKQKIQDHYDPPSKRMRTDFYNKHEEQKRKFREDIDSHTTSEIEYNLQCGLSMNMQSVSCQSPDYVQIDNVMVIKPKEIMNTASIPLEDPRLTNKKYLLRKMNDNTETLFIVNSRDVDLEPVNKRLWNIDQVEMPKALQKPPSYSDDFVKQLYTDIDNPTSSISVESSEIKNPDDCNQSNGTKNINNSETEKIHNETNQNVTVQNEESKDNINTEKLNDTKINNYRISKKHNSDICSITKYPSSFASNESDMCNNIELNLCNKTVVRSCQNIDKDEPFSLNVLPSDKILEGNDTLNFGCKDTSDNKNKIDIMTSELINEKQSAINNIVADDLELSDENVCSSEYNNKVSEHRTVTAQGKRHNSKKKSSKHREPGPQTTSEELLDKKKCNNEQVEHDKHKSKKENEDQTKNIQSKFTDLFGDSCSLITPEDLAVTEPTTKVTEQYDTIFEDAQNAIDLNIEDMLKIKKQFKEKADASKEKVKETNSDNKVDSKSKSGKINKITENKKKKSKKSDEESKNLNEKTNLRSKNNEKLTVDNVQDKEKNTKELIQSETAMGNESKTIKPHIDLQKNLKINNSGQDDLEKQTTNSYKNVYSNSDPEPDIVKTVVISTGVQFQCTQNNVMETENLLQSYQKGQNDNVKNTNMPIATSTPCKILSNSTDIREDTKIISTHSSDAVDNASVSQDGVTLQTTEQTASSNAVLQPNDVPDVRIFVRRRKPLKKCMSSVR